MAVNFGVIEKSTDWKDFAIGEDEKMVLFYECPAVVIGDIDGRWCISILCWIARQADHHVRSFSGPMNRQHEPRIVQRKLESITNRQHFTKGQIYKLDRWHIYAQSWEKTPRPNMIFITAVLYIRCEQ